MVEIDIQYQGQLHCTLRHGPSGTEIMTDAPKDNMGKGEAFSPTDLLAASLGACMATTMAIVANRHQIDLAGMKVHVVKEMVAQPSRRVGRLRVTITMPRTLPEEQRAMLERTARTCPVELSLSPDVKREVTFLYP